MLLKINTTSKRKIYRYHYCIFLCVIFHVYLYSIDIIDANKVREKKYNYFIIKNYSNKLYRVYFLLYALRQIYNKRGYSFIYIKIKSRAILSTQELIKG